MINIECDPTRKIEQYNPTKIRVTNYCSIYLGVTIIYIYIYVYRIYH